MPKVSIVVFAQVPPPEHGQSRMVALALETLRGHPEDFEVCHVNARFSSSLEEIGESSIGKMLLTAKYLAQAIRIRVGVRSPILYYVPGPVKWSAVLRDWSVLSVLRVFYPRVVFHWHAIGHGEWAHGSERLRLNGPQWLDRWARMISGWVLDAPFASIAVSGTSRNDSHAVSSQRERIVCNGIADPCPDFDDVLAPLRQARQQGIAAAARPLFKILFLSHGTEEKGTLDALDCLVDALKHGDPSWCFQITFAGGISDSIRSRFDSAAGTLVVHWPDRIHIIEDGYLTGDDKNRCFIGHDVFLAPSRWESFGLTVVEAMAHGMQIVAAASDGVKGVLPDGHPYLAPVADPPGLASKLLECCAALSDRPLVDEGRALREHFLEHYQIQDFSQNLVRAFLEFEEAREPSLESGKQKAESGKQSANSLLSSESKIQNPKSKIFLSSAPLGDLGALAVNLSSSSASKIKITAYLADQNPGHDRSFGISRMSQVVLEALQASGQVEIAAITSTTSQQAPAKVATARILPWGTRGKWVRLLTDHFHPLFGHNGFAADLHYFPKGYLPLLVRWCRPSVVTIHDTIIQHDDDYYPRWRTFWEYTYWALMLKHTLRRADLILTVSESSKQQIHAFMDRHFIARKEITVTYEPCQYESIPQPIDAAKENYVIHLASCEPHKRTAHLIRWWHEAEARGMDLPMLHLIGTVPPEVELLLASARTIVKQPFLEEAALQSAYRAARALILPSEIEGFGLPALEAYYLGTPVCFVKNTSVDEILGVATRKGGFSLARAESLFAALDEVMAMDPAEIYQCGLTLRDAYAADKVAERMISVFEKVREEKLKAES